MAMQLSLAIQLSDAARFDNYYATENTYIVDLLKANREAFVYLWSRAATGKTHLLQAMCHYIQALGSSAIYLPLAVADTLHPDMLEGLESYTVICIDDIDSVAADAHWEQALFNLYNRARDAGSKIYVTARASPNSITFELADLRSRLTWGPVYQLQILNDEDKRRALQLRAKNRGVELPDEVADYLFKRYPRDLHSLFELLERLDSASLQAQRRLTIPFIKSLIK